MYGPTLRWELKSSKERTSPSAEFDALLSIIPAFIDAVTYIGISLPL